MQTDATAQCGAYPQLTSHMSLGRLSLTLSGLPAKTQATLDAGAAQSIFHSRAWYENYLETVQNQRAELLFLTATGDTTGAVLPTQIILEGSGPRILTGIHNYYSCLFGPILSGTPDLRLFKQLFQPLQEIQPDMIELRALDQECPGFPLIIQALRHYGWWVDTQPDFGDWQLDVAGRSYAEYFADLPSRQRNTITRKKQLLLKAGNVRFEIIDSNQNIERLIQDYTRIYNASWKQPEPYPEFMPGLIRTCARQGWLRAALAYVDGQPAAAQIWIVHQQQALIYKLAYDKQFGKLSVGSILTALLMEYVIDVDKVKLVDYLMGDDPYKRDWMSRRIERWSILAFNPRSLHGLLGATRYFGSKWLRRFKPAGNRDPLSPTTDRNNH